MQVDISCKEGKCSVPMLEQEIRIQICHVLYRYIGATKDLIPHAKCKTPATSGSSASLFVPADWPHVTFGMKALSDVKINGVLYSHQPLQNGINNIEAGTMVLFKSKIL